MEVYRPPHGKDPFCMNPGWIFKARRGYLSRSKESDKITHVFRRGETLLLIKITGHGFVEKNGINWKYDLTFFAPEGETQKILTDMVPDLIVDCFELIWPYGHIV